MVGPIGRRIRRELVGIAVAAASSSAAAQGDWLDDMPSVAVVAQAVREQARSETLRVPSGSFTGGARPAMPADDPDHYATRLAGTFAMLRWFMLFEALREANPPAPPGTIAPLREPSLSDQRRSRMDAIAVEYRQAELAIERGLGKRAGYIKKVCDRKDSYLNRLGGKMFATPQDCYRWRYGIDVDGSHIQFAWRRAIFPRLFCEKGQRYHERYQEYYTDASHKHRGNPGPRPHNHAFVRVKQWPVIAQPQTTAAVCTAHGGDANGDGLCDSWEGPIKSSRGNCSPRIELVGIKVIDSSSVRVDFKRLSGSGVPQVQFELIRGNPQTGQVQAIPVSIAGLLPAPTPSASHGPSQHPIAECRRDAIDAPDTTVRPTQIFEALVLKSTSNLLLPDASKPWLRIRASLNGSQIANGEAACKQAVPVPPFSEILRMSKEGRLTGLFGPYDTANLAAIAVEPTARDFTAWTSAVVPDEVGAFIVRDLRGGSPGYYVTIPKQGEKSFPYVAPGRVSPQDYAASLESSFRSDSCELKESYQFVGYFHTHPIDYRPFHDDGIRFSETDWQTAYCLRHDPIMSTLERSYLFRVDGCIDSIDGRTRGPNLSAVTPVKSCSRQ